ncbi:hypothetical protein [Achromobacter xylosoxidans]|uniref:hypothetical protein n=1 Tax=Alcaligenes xylosoxydans xylosoxydans TaxID=85698 RepID=UPI001F0F7CA4|nr:hypothetical protein [Achromobacter xylosoxidans]MCH4574983.1 hypothetical protein [Achromobacter xylosoxidans]
MAGVVRPKETSPERKPGLLFSRYDVHSKPYMECDVSKRTFTAEVKERAEGEPCFIWIAANNDIGIGDESILLELQEPATIEHARRVAQFLHENVRSFKLST